MAGPEAHSGMEGSQVASGSKEKERMVPALGSPGGRQSHTQILL